MSERLKNRQWTFDAAYDGSYSWEAVTAALLMDIRDELQKLNQLLGCSNFLGIPHALNVIAKNTKKRKPKRRRLKVAG